MIDPIGEGMTRARKFMYVPGTEERYGIYILGIASDLMGYDGSSAAFRPEKLSKKDREAVADFAISLWTKFKNCKRKRK
jgi:hypothetical protein